MFGGRRSARQAHVSKPLSAQLARLAASRQPAAAWRGAGVSPHLPDRNQAAAGGWCTARQRPVHRSKDELFL
jgi:hypothetical protein